MRAGFGMHGDVIAAGFGKCLEIRIDRRDHQVGVEDFLAVRAHRLDDVGAVGNVGDEMPVHHVEMDPVGAGRIDRAHFSAEIGEICGKDRRRDTERAHLLASLARIAHLRRHESEARTYLEEALRLARRSDARELVKSLETLERAIAV